MSFRDSLFFWICLAVITTLVFSQPSESTFLWLMIGMLVSLAVIAAAHETAADGFYIRALDAKGQAQFIGIKTAANRIGSLSVVMGLLLLATKIAETYGATGVESVDKTGFHVGFGVAYAIGMGVMFLFLIWNWWKLPRLRNDQPVKHTSFAIREVILEYFQQRRVFVIITFILLYRFGEGFLLLKGPFYLDPHGAGGLGVQASALPYYTLFTDIPWAIIGGIAGGFLIKAFGFKRMLLPLVLCMSLPNLAYAALAWFQPHWIVFFLGEEFNVWLLLASSVESVGYGLSFSGMFYYMHIMATEAGRNKTSILAISFALMNVGFLFPGMMSGFVEGAVGYVGLFILSGTIGLLVLLLLPVLPLPRGESSSEVIADENQP